MVAVVTVTGSSGAGKTTFVERVIPLLRAEGLKVGSCKHASHGYQADAVGSDSHRHHTAGADPVVLLGPDSHVVFVRGRPDVDLLVDRHLAHLDLVLVEGLASRPGPKILVHRAEVPPRDRPPADEVLFVLTDEPVTLPSTDLAAADPPQLASDDLDEAAALLVDHVRARSQDRPRWATAVAEEITVQVAADGEPVDLDDVVVRDVVAELLAGLGPRLADTSGEITLRVKLR